MRLLMHDVAINKITYNKPFFFPRVIFCCEGGSSHHRHHHSPPPPPYIKDTIPIFLIVISDPNTHEELEIK